MPYKIIVAYAKKNRVIGAGGKIPWRLPRDFQHFQETTTGGVLIMGRVTYESLGCIGLRNRQILVLTNNNTYGWDEMVDDNPKMPYKTSILSKDAIPAIDHFARTKDVWVCGGQKIYELFLPKCSEVIVSEVEGDYEGDAFMPEFKSKNRSLIQEHDGFKIWKCEL